MLQFIDSSFSIDAEPVSCECAFDHFINGLPCSGEAKAVLSKWSYAFFDGEWTIDSN
jgi:hypothetical protein